MNDENLFHAINIITSQIEASPDDLLQATTMTNEIIFSLDGFFWCLTHFSPQKSPAICLFMVQCIRHWLINGWDELNPEIRADINRILFEVSPPTLSAGPEYIRITQQYSSALADCQVRFMLYSYPEQWPSFWSDILKRGTGALHFISAFAKYVPTPNTPEVQILNNIQEFMSSTGHMSENPEMSDLSMVIGFCITNMADPLAVDALTQLLQWCSPESCPFLDDSVISSVAQGVTQLEMAETSFRLLTSLATWLGPSNPAQLAAILGNYGILELMQGAVENYWIAEAPVAPSAEEISARANENLERKLQEISIENEEMPNLMKETMKEAVAEVKAEHFMIERAGIDPVTILAEAGRFISQVIRGFSHPFSMFGEENEMEESFHEIATAFVPLATHFLEHPNQECAETTETCLRLAIEMKPELAVEILPVVFWRYTQYLMQNPVEIDDFAANLENIAILSIEKSTEFLQPFYDSVISSTSSTQTNSGNFANSRPNLYESTILFRVMFQTFRSKRNQFRLENPLISNAISFFIPVVSEIATNPNCIEEDTIFPLYYSLTSFVEFLTALPADDQLQVGIFQPCFDALVAILFAFKSFQENFAQISGQNYGQNSGQNSGQNWESIEEMAEENKLRFERVFSLIEALAKNSEGLAATAEVIGAFLSMGVQGGRVTAKIIAKMDERTRFDAISSIFQAASGNLVAILTFLGDQGYIDRTAQPVLFESIQKFYIESLEAAKSEDSLLSLYVRSIVKSLQEFAAEIVGSLEPVGSESALAILSNSQSLISREYTKLKSISNIIPTAYRILLPPLFSQNPQNFAQNSQQNFSPNSQQNFENIAEMSEAERFRQINPAIGEEEMSANYGKFLEVKGQYEAAKREFESGQWTRLGPMIVGNFADYVIQAIESIENEEWREQSQEIKEVDSLVFNYFGFAAQVLGFLVGSVQNSGNSENNGNSGSGNSESGNVVEALFGVVNAAISSGFPKLMGYGINGLIGENGGNYMNGEFLGEGFRRFFVASVMITKSPLFGDPGKQTQFGAFSTKALKWHHIVFGIMPELVEEAVNATFGGNAAQYMEMIAKGNHPLTQLLSFLQECFP